MLQHMSTGEVTDQGRWAAVLARDRRADGTFYYAVSSTGVFCKPSCPSRRPRRDRVQFFSSVAAAERAGYRPCRRCHPTATGTPRGIATAISRAAAYLSSHVDAPVTLARLAKIANLSPSHFQRQFKRVLGLSPREYHAALRADRFRHALRSGRDVTSALYEVGYGSPSRVYDSAPTGRGLSPSQYMHGANGVAIGYEIVRTPLGQLLVAGTSSGVCAVKLGDSARDLEDELRREFPSAEIAADGSLAAGWVKAIADHLSGSNQQLDVPLDVQGTAFQRRVWNALRDIPFGETRAYSDVARAIGEPTAVRAVARACATNPVCLVVPCHRVVPRHGAPGGYRWGPDRKRRLLALEAGPWREQPRKAK